MALNTLKCYHLMPLRFKGLNLSLHDTTHLVSNRSMWRKTVHNARCQSAETLSTSRRDSVKVSQVSLIHKFVSSVLPLSADASCNITFIRINQRSNLDTTWHRAHAAITYMLCENHTRKMQHSKTLHGNLSILMPSLHVK